jgi:DNA-binding PadR family transcriptional regulator
MHARERKALEQFAGGPAKPPRGVAGTTLFNLIQKGWIVRSERDQNFGPELYNLTDKGRQAFLSDINSD